MKHIVGLSLLLLISNLLLGQNAKPLKTSLLWEISVKGSKQKSYLYGTFHIQCKDDWKVTPTMKKKLENCKVLYEEMDESQMNNPFKLMLKLRSDTPISKRMDSASYINYSRVFKELTGISAELFDDYKPFMATSTLTAKFINCTETLSPEKELVEVAKSKKIPVKGFETIEEQLNAFNNVPMDSQINSLKSMCNNVDSMKRTMQKMIDVYKSRDLDKLFEMVKFSEMGNNAEDDLLNNRNANWMPTIEMNVIKQSTFIAVGAAHLCGEKGLINLLRQKGYIVKPISY